MRLVLLLCLFFCPLSADLRAADAPAVPVLLAPGLVSTGHDDAHAAFSPDGQTLYFLRNSPDFSHWTILTAQRDADAAGGWGSLAVAAFSGRWDDADVFVSTDNQRLYFVSNRPAPGRTPGADTDIWMMSRSATGWGPPRRLDALASPGYEWFPTEAADGTLYFGSERAGGLGQTDLWRARRLGDHFAAPENLGPVINTAGQEIEPLIAPDQSWLIFAARRSQPPAGGGQYDLYISYNCPSGWTAPVPLPGGVNSPGWDFGPRLSPDGTRFYFTSNRTVSWRAGGKADTVKTLTRRLESPGNGLRDIYSIDAAMLPLHRTCPPPGSAG